MRKVVFLLVVLVCSAAGVFGQQTTEGSLYAVGKQGNELGACPLKSTAVKADISGFISRVRVRQEFENSFTEPIEAIYVFPLSQNGAVDEMTMTVGSRVIRGKIMRREEARQTYETAKAAGKTAGLLDQERPNIFTQLVANIMPGERVIVEISYVETLKYEDGAYEFVFPMTIGPRYIPNGVSDAAKISPPIAATRNGSDISVEVNVNAGVPVEEIRSSSHEITQVSLSPSSSHITLKDEKVIPNKDFILRYDVTGKRIEDAILTHRDPRGGFFTLILQPPDKVATEDRTPKEIVFVLDTSGSMGGFPIEKAKEAMKLSLEGLYPEDTFNLITFAGDTAILFDKPVPATQANLATAQQFLAERRGYGGTEMMKAIKAALDPSDSSAHLRIVCFMTDAFIGNDDEVVAEIQRHPNARVFSFGIGSSVNRSLLDRMAVAGKGEVEYVGLNDDGSAAAKRFYERVRTPLLTDLSIDWNGMQVADVYPGRLTDLFSAKPVILHGRYTKGGSGTIRLKGKLAGQAYEREIAVNFPETESANDALSTLWARTRIEELSMARLKATDPKKGDEMDTLITNIGLDFGLMTKFTSFVAVEERVANPNGDPAKVTVPNVLPEGMDPANATAGAYKKWISNDVGYIISKPESGGGASQTTTTVAGSPVKKTRALRSNGTGSGSGQGSGVGYGSGSGAGSGVASMVTVTADASVTVDTSQTQISTNITRRVVEQLPQGTTFTSLLRTVPNARAESLAGGFQIDGASGSENTFVIDGRRRGDNIFIVDLTEYNAEFGSPSDAGIIPLDPLEIAKAQAEQLGSSGASSGPKPKRSKQTVDHQLQGRMIGAAEPVYPKDAAAAKALGIVTVNIAVDSEGNVTSAKAESGHPLLVPAAEAAAMLSKFAPMWANGNRVRVTGTLVYDFLTATNVQVFVRKMKAEPPTAEELVKYNAANKLHFWLFAVADRLDKKIAEPTPNEPMFVRDGKAEVQVELTARSKELDAKLKAAGFEMAGEKGKSRVAGRIAIEKLASLAAIEEVKLILPKI